MVNISTGVAGFEPTRKRVKVLCLTAWLYPNNDLCNHKGLLLGEYMKYSNRVTTDRVSVIQNNCSFTMYIHWYDYPIVAHWEFI